MLPILKLTFSHVLENLRNDFEKEKKISENSLAKLSFLFDITATQALDLIDHKYVSRIQSPSGRELFQIQEAGNESYICFKHSNYCTCPAFACNVLKGNYLMCRHRLAAILATAMNLCQEIHYTDETVALMIAGES